MSRRLAWVALTGTCLALAGMGCGDDAGASGDSGVSDGGASDGGELPNGNETDAASGSSGTGSSETDAGAGDAGDQTPMSGGSAFSGALDTAFAGGSTLMQSQILGARSTNGKILLFTPDPASSMNVRICRFGFDGPIDTTYGTMGCAIAPGFDAFVGEDHFDQFDTDSQGRVYFVGEAYVAPGDFRPNAVTVTRFDATGAIDATFGTAGKVTVLMSSLAGNTDKLVDMGSIKLLDDGSMLLGGTFQPMYGEATKPMRKWALVKLKPSGEVDTGFNASGYVLFDSGLPDTLQLITEAPDKSIFVAGYHYADVGSPRYFHAAKVSAAGVRDMSYGDKGFAIIAPDGYTLNYIAADAKGRLVGAGGYPGTDSKAWGAFGTRLLANGKLDTGFANKGELVVDFVTLPFDSATATDRFTCVFFDGDQLVFSGVSTGRDSYIGIAVVNEDGALDPDFAFTPLLGQIWKTSPTITMTGTTHGLGGAAVLPTPDGKQLIGIGNRLEKISLFRWE